MERGLFFDVAPGSCRSGDRVPLSLFRPGHSRPGAAERAGSSRSQLAAGRNLPVDPGRRCVFGVRRPCPGVDTETSRDIMGLECPTFASIDVLVILTAWAASHWGGVASIPLVAPGNAVSVRAPRTTGPFHSPWNSSLLSIFRRSNGCRRRWHPLCWASNASTSTGVKPDPTSWTREGGS